MLATFVKSSFRIVVASQIAVLIAVPLNVQAQNPVASAPGSLDQSGTQWAPFIEWSVVNANYVGNPFDLVASVTFVHAQTGVSHTTEMFFAGDSTWKFRFTGTKTGLWTFTSSSEDADLDSLKGTVAIEPNPNPEIDGFLVAQGSKFARQTGPEGELKAEIPKVYMNLGMHEIDGVPFPMSLMSQPQVRREYIQETIDNGHNALFIHMNNQWFSWDAVSYYDHDREDPELASFEVLESLIVEAHAAGLQTIIWAWGDEERRWTPIGVGGINGVPDQRLQRYIAARLGPLPGWSLGYGFDLWEWTTEEQMQAWAAYLHEHMGWPHLLWARERSNTEIDVVSNDLRPNGEPQDQFYQMAISSFDSSNNRPVMFGRRFAFMRDSIFTMDKTRRSMWQFAMAGGAGSWWGFFANSPFPYPNPEQLVAHEQFWQTHFRLDFQADTLITDGAALRVPENTHYVFYKEDTDSIRMNLTAMTGMQEAYAVDTRLGYQEIHLGTFLPDSLTWIAPYPSDWAVAVGNFGSSAGPDLRTPVISMIEVQALTDKSAVIVWRTDEASDSQVEYGLDTTYGQQTALDGSLVTSHSQELTGLAANTTYHYRVLSKDAAGNLALSADQSFTTTALPPPVAPVELRA
ncbi:DUF5060 domain-containing protein, partial [candidate division KSB1 bacterium]|nr:DUF5060 domain-containing protein [candidate division KSB1 bacterium]